LPEEWKDGKEVWVYDVPHASEYSKDHDFSQLDDWLQRMDALCADSDPNDEAIMQAAIDEHRRLGKLMMRREMGL
jgi:hypothetical protein